MADAGWYPDPQDPRSHRYFDGQRWTGESRPASPPVPPRAFGSERTAEQPQPQPPAQPQGQGQPQPPRPQQGQPPYSPPAGQQQWPSYQQRSDDSTKLLPPVPGQQYQSGQPGQQSPPGQQMGWQSPGAGGWQQPGAPGGRGASPWGGPATPPKRKRWPLLVGLGVVLLLVAGALAVVFWPSSSKDAPKFTYQGKEIAEPDSVLATTETRVAALVKQRHGAQAKSSRCYYAQPETPVSGQKKSDVDQSLRCGPVLFVDGNQSRNFLAVPLTSAASGDKVTLQTPRSLTGIEPSTVDSGLLLARPDGKTAPAGNTGLAVPQPPPAYRGLLTATSLGSTAPPPTLDDAKIVGKTTSVTVTAAGEIKRYGEGDAARSAPVGGKLIAFQVSYGSGAVSGGGSARAAITLNNGTARSLPDASGSDQWIIVAVAPGEQPVLIFNDGGFPQTLSLPDAKPGPDNIAVLSRAHRTDLLAKSAAVPIRISNSNGSTRVTFQARANIASLNFWVPRHTGRHPTDPSRAMLSIDLDYTDSSAPGKRYGFDPQLLRVRLPNGTLVPARNVAVPGKIYNVFEVPADFTTGTLEITGSEQVQGLTLTVISTVSFPISILPG